jgi:hypothetical protein
MTNIIAVFGAITLASGATAAWRIGQRVPPADLIAVARATGSPRACVGFIQFCLKS